MKFIDIWFLACTCFIFLSLLEFAVVNTIWRRKYDLISLNTTLTRSSHCRDTVHIKRLTSGKIFREGLKEVKRTAFSTPVMSRKNSLDTSYRRKFSAEDLDQDRPKSKVSVSSLVGETLNTLL